MMRIFEKLTRQSLSDFIKQNADPNLKTLDLGCGPAPYASSFHDRIGFDITPNTGVDVVGDIHRMPFSDGSFGQILCTEVLEHCYNPWKAVDEMNRVLMTEGKIILTTRFIFPHHDTPNDYFRFTEMGIKKLFSAENGWELTVFHPESDTQQAMGILVQRIAFQSKVFGGKFSVAVLHLLASFIFYSPNIFVREYGDIQKKNRVGALFSSGYYIVARKIKVE